MSIASATAKAVETHAAQVKAPAPEYEAADGTRVPLHTKREAICDACPICPEVDIATSPPDRCAVTRGPDRCERGFHSDGRHMTGGVVWEEGETEAKPQPGLWANIPLSARPVPRPEVASFVDWPDEDLERRVADLVESPAHLRPRHRLVREEDVRETIAGLERALGDMTDACVDLERTKDRGWSRARRWEAFARRTWAKVAALEDLDRTHEPIDSMKLCCVICGEPRPDGEPKTLVECAEGTVRDLGRWIAKWVAAANACDRLRGSGDAMCSLLAEMNGRGLLARDERARFEAAEAAWKSAMKEST